MARNMAMEPMTTQQVEFSRWNLKIVLVLSIGALSGWAPQICQKQNLKSFIEHLAGKYRGDTYHLIVKNCNHFSDDVCMRLTGKPIPGWVNRLAKLGSLCNCLLPESIQVTAVRHLPDDQEYSDEGSDSVISSPVTDSDDEDPDHHLLTAPNLDVTFVRDKPVRLARELL